MIRCRLRTRTRTSSWVWPWPWLPLPLNIRFDELTLPAEDEQEALDKGTILEGDRLRHAYPQTQNQYNEGLDEDDLPDDVRYGTSGVSGTKRLS